MSCWGFSALLFHLWEIECLHFGPVFFYDLSNQKNCRFLWAWVSHFFDTEWAPLYAFNTNVEQIPAHSVFKQSYDKIMPPSIRQYSITLWRFPFLRDADLRLRESRTNPISFLEFPKFYKTSRTAVGVAHSSDLCRAAATSAQSAQHGVRGAGGMEGCCSCTRLYWRCLIEGSRSCEVMDSSLASLGDVLCSPQQVVSSPLPIS